MSPRRRRVAVPLAFLALLVVAACGGGVDNGDLFKKGGGTTTTSGGTPTATATSTPPSNPTANPPTTLPKPSPQCAVSFATDVMQVFDKAGCAALGCHNGEAVAPPMDPTSPALTYKSLSTFTMSTGDPYVAVGSTDPNASGITCNLRGGCGTRMPIGSKRSSNELSVIDNWLACGAPFN